MGLGVLSQYTQLILGPPLSFGTESLACVPWSAQSWGFCLLSFLVILELMGVRNTSSLQIGGGKSWSWGSPPSLGKPSEGPRWSLGVWWWLGPHSEGSACFLRAVSLLAPGHTGSSFMVPRSPLARVCLSCQLPLSPQEQLGIYKPFPGNSRMSWPAPLLLKFPLLFPFF